MNQFLLFGFLSLICTVMIIINRRNQKIPTTSSEFFTFQLFYLIPYTLSVTADWLQGPYVYALYESYGYTIRDIGMLFIVGFGSSALFGVFIGAFSDKYGRKNSCIIYTILYAASCLTKHSPNFHILLLGRVTGGIATSILFSSFESWMVSEHYRHKHSDDWLSYTFYLQVFLNSIAAIVSGLLASFVKDFFNAYTAPFDVAVLFLILCGILIILWWEENYGSSANTEVTAQDWKLNVLNGFYAIRNDPIVLCLGISQSLFEAAMYIFVFMWTPMLDQYYAHQYSHGVVFACFMIAVMIGGSVFNFFSELYPIEVSLFYVFAVTTISFLLTALNLGGPICLINFLVFEACVGMFWPSIGTLKGKYIPEDVRATVMNYFRLPTNMLVLFTLDSIKKLSYPAVFLICSIFAAISILSQAYIISRKGLSFTKQKKKSENSILA